MIVLGGSVFNRYYWIGLVCLYLIPVVIYGFVFGVGVWDSHDDWSKMGGALGGIYSPLIAFTTLLLLYRQQRFNEMTYEQTTRSDFIQRVYAKCESYISLAGAQCSKLDANALDKFINLLALYVETEDKESRESIFELLNIEFRPQLASLTRAGVTIHHMKNSDVDLTGQISDLRVYAASLIDVDVLIAHDSYHREFIGDGSYYSFEPSPSELERMQKGLEEIRNGKS